MKQQNLCLLLCLIANAAIAQKGYDYNYVGNTDKYFTEAISPDFKNRFDTDEKRKDFKELREYLNEKDDLLQALNNQRLGMQRSIFRYDTVELSKYTELLKKIILKKSDEKEIVVRWELIQQYQSEVEYNEDYQQDELTVTVSYVKEVIAYYEKQIDEGRQILKKLNVSDKNIKILKQDIYECRNQIDSTLAPEYKQQEFRITISICFAALIGMLLIVFFFIVYKRSDINLSKELLSGNGLQFVTLFVLIIAIILFGILSILQGSELAAILSGISGYILGKGTQNTQATTT
jgi:uncharacterized protein YktA (UPF0223 family)